MARGGLFSFAQGPLEAALTRLSVSRRVAVGAPELLDALRRPSDAGRPLVDAFLTDVPVEVLHDGVLAGFWTFDELAAAAAFHEVQDAERRRWLEEMASGELARPA